MTTARSDLSLEDVGSRIETITSLEELKGYEAQARLLGLVPGEERLIQAREQFLRRFRK